VVSLPFRKRTFSGPGQFIKETFSLLKSWRRIRKAMRSEVIPPAFRERLMLAVTAVNDCRYCSYAHSKEALKHGISQTELEQLLSGEFKGCPRREIPAIFYAQHWAESDGKPQAEALDELEKNYSSQEIEYIHLYLRMIRLGNLAGNSWDYMISRLPCLRRYSR
jgi:AhpD family alkylhydroperoxidase